MQLFYVKKTALLKLPHKQLSLEAPPADALSTEQIPITNVYCGNIAWEVIHAKEAVGAENVVVLPLRPEITALLPAAILPCSSGQDLVTQIRSIVDRRPEEKRHQPIRIALLNGVGTMLGDTLIGSSALEIAVRKLRAAVGEVEVHAVLAWNARPGTELILERSPAVSHVRGRSITLAELHGFDAYYDFSSLLLMEGYNDIPLIDFYLNQLGIDPASVPADEKLPQLRLPGTVIDEAKKTIAQHSHGRKVVLVQGLASTPIRSMPDSFMAELVNDILRKTDACVLLTQSMSDESLFKDSDRVIRLAQWCQASTDHYLALAVAVDALVSIDSLAIHVAAAARIPGIVIFTTLMPDLRLAYAPHLKGLLIPDATSLSTWGKHKIDSRWPEDQIAYNRAWAAMDRAPIVDDLIFILSEKQVVGAPVHIPAGGMWPSALAQAQQSAFQACTSQTVTIAQALQMAIACHQAGRLPEAENIYHQILLMQPQHADANHNLGVLLLQANQPHDALPFLEAALHANADNGQYWLSLVECQVCVGTLEKADALLHEFEKRGWRHSAVEELRRKISSGRSANLLVELFSEGDVAQAVAVANDILASSPDNGKAWHIVGLAYLLKNENDAALAALSRASGLLSNDCEVWDHLGLAYTRLSRFDEAKNSFNRSLAIDPRRSATWNNAAKNAIDAGQFAEGTELANRAIEVAPNEPGGYINRGNALQGSGQLGAALESYRCAIDLDTGIASAHYNAGNALYRLGRESGDPGYLNRAVLSFKRAIQLQPAYTDAHNNLASALCELGDIDSAIISRQHAFQLRPEDAALVNDLAYLFKNQGKLHEAAVFSERAYSIAPDSIAGLMSVVRLVVIYFLQNDRERASDMLDRARPILSRTEHILDSSKAYYEYMNKLLAWWRNAGAMTDVGDRYEILHVVGDSHMLSLHGIRIVADGKAFLCQGRWIEGCKQWHLGNAALNEYKYQFIRAMTEIPRNAPVLLVIGEIDCRLNEGIMKARAKSTGLSIEEIALSTINGFLDYVAQFAEIEERKVIVCGVPATNVRLDLVTSDETQRFFRLIKFFNNTLRESSLTRGMDFLDVFAMTDNGYGKSTEEWHIDAYHLRPDALIQAFEKFHLTEVA